MTDTITLHAYQFIVDDVFPDKPFFTDFHKKLQGKNGKNSLKTSSGETIAFIERNYQEDDKFIYLNFSLGSDLEYKETVIDTLKGNIEKPNPKKKFEIEPVDNAYIFYSFIHNEMLISSKSKTKIESLLKYYYKDSKFVFKRVIHDFDKFVSGLKELSEIRLVLKENSIFSNASDYTGLMNDIYGFDDPSSFELKALFKKRKFFDKDRKKLEKLKEKADKNNVNSLIIVGNDADDIERKFRTDKYYSVIKIEVSQSDNQTQISNKVLLDIRKKYNIF